VPDQLPDISHECPYPGCTRRVRRAQFSCPWHWTVLPSELRQRVRSNYGRDWGAHVAAMRAGIDWYEQHAEAGS
jgi:hypothetical protein